MPCGRQRRRHHVVVAGQGGAGGVDAVGRRRAQLQLAARLERDRGAVREGSEAAGELDQIVEGHDPLRVGAVEDVPLQLRARPARSAPGGSIAGESGPGPWPWSAGARDRTRTSALRPHRPDDTVRLDHRPGTAGTPAVAPAHAPLIPTRGHRCHLLRSAHVSHLTTGRRTGVRRSPGISDAAWYPGAVKIEDYALIGDTQTAGLVSTAGSIDWLCLPRFDSGACFAALLGDERDGRWLLAPDGRRSRPGGAATAPARWCWRPSWRRPMVRCGSSTACRSATAPRTWCGIVEGLRGRVPMHMELILRFDYGSVVPWVRQVDGRLRATAGPDSIELVTPVETRGEDFRTARRLHRRSPAIGVPFLLRWHPSHEPPPPLDRRRGGGRRTPTPGGRSGRREPTSTSATTAGATRCMRSLITLKALTYAPTGGIVAAATTSLPEKIGGVRNWDYRYCWLRDATFTLYSLMLAGYVDEATAWRDWLLRAVAGEPSKLQIMYGAGGRAPARRVRAAPPGRLRGIAAGAHRQRRQRAVPARRLRRGDGRHAPGPPGRA